MRTRSSRPSTVLATSSLLALSLAVTACGDDDPNPNDNPDAGDVTDTTDPQPVTTVIDVPGADFGDSATLSDDWVDGATWTSSTWYGDASWAITEPPAAMTNAVDQAAVVTITANSYTRIATDMLLDAVEGEELTLTVDAFASFSDTNDTLDFVAAGAIVAMLRTEYLNAGFFPAGAAQWAAADFLRLDASSGDTNGTLEASFVVPRGFAERPVFVMLFAQTQQNADPVVVSFDNVRLERAVYPDVDQGPELDNDDFEFVAPAQGVFSETAPLGWLWDVEEGCGYAGIVNHGDEAAPQGARSGTTMMEVDSCPLYRAITVPETASGVVARAYVSVRADVSGPADGVALQLLEDDEGGPAVVANGQIDGESLGDTWQPLTVCHVVSGGEQLLLRLQHTNVGARVLVDDVTVSFEEGACDR